MSVETMHQILDLARWAPSGDNSQPWRFEVLDEERLRIHGRDDADHDIYDYAGRGSLLSLGMLLESIRVAASRYGRKIRWSYEPGDQPHRHLIDVTLTAAPELEESSLLPMLIERSVDRTLYQTKSLGIEQKDALEQCLGAELGVSWQESPMARLRLIGLIGRSTDIRMRSREAHEVHQRVMDWKEKRSPDGMPVGSLGLDPLTQRLLGWMMKDWKRVDQLNRLTGTGLPVLELDVLPGLFSAAHFIIWQTDQSSPVDALALLRSGERLQHLWLTATALGLVLQPTWGPLAFTHYARHGGALSDAPDLMRKSRRLDAELRQICVGIEPDTLIFMARIGWPRSQRASERPRSVRRPLEALLQR